MSLRADPFKEAEIKPNYTIMVSVLTMMSSTMLKCCQQADQVRSAHVIKFTGLRNVFDFDVWPMF